jgi:hypothetical protein
MDWGRPILAPWAEPTITAEGISPIVDATIAHSGIVAARVLEPAIAVQIATTRPWTEPPVAMTVWTSTSDKVSEGMNAKDVERISRFNLYFTFSNPEAALANIMDWDGNIDFIVHLLQNMNTLEWGMKKVTEELVWNLKKITPEKLPTQLRTELETMFVSPVSQILPEMLSALEALNTPINNVTENPPKNLAYEQTKVLGQKMADNLHIYEPLLIQAIHITENKDSGVSPSTVATAQQFLDAVTALYNFLPASVWTKAPQMKERQKEMEKLGKMQDVFWALFRLQSDVGTRHFEGTLSVLQAIIVEAKKNGIYDLVDQEIAQKWYAYVQVLQQPGGDGEWKFATPLASAKSLKEVVEYFTLEHYTSDMCQPILKKELGITGVEALIWNNDAYYEAFSIMFALVEAMVDGAKKIHCKALCEQVRGKYALVEQHTQSIKVILDELKKSIWTENFFQERIDEIMLLIQAIPQYGKLRKEQLERQLSTLQQAHKEALEKQYIENIQTQLTQLSRHIWTQEFSAERINEITRMISAIPISWTQKKDPLQAELEALNEAHQELLQQTHRKALEQQSIQWHKTDITQVQQTLFPDTFGQMYTTMMLAVKAHLGNEEFMSELLYTERMLGNEYRSFVYWAQASVSDSDIRHYYREDLKARKNAWKLNKNTVLEEIQEMINVISLDSESRIGSILYWRISDAVDMAWDFWVGDEVQLSKILKYIPELDSFLKQRAEDKRVAQLEADFSMWLTERELETPETAARFFELYDVARFEAFQTPVEKRGDAFQKVRMLEEMLNNFLEEKGTQREKSEFGRLKVNTAQYEVWYMDPKNIGIHRNHTVVPSLAMRIPVRQILGRVFSLLPKVQISIPDPQLEVFRQTKWDFMKNDHITLLQKLLEWDHEGYRTTPKRVSKIITSLEKQILQSRSIHSESPMYLLYVQVLEFVESHFPQETYLRGQLARSWNEIKRYVEMSTIVKQMYEVILWDASFDEKNKVFTGGKRQITQILATLGIQWHKFSQFQVIADARDFSDFIRIANIAKIPPPINEQKELAA